MNSQSAVRRYPHSFSIEQILAKPEMRRSTSFEDSVQDESGRGGNCLGASRASSPATSSCLDDNMDDGKSDIDLASDDGNGAYDRYAGI